MMSILRNPLLAASRAATQWDSKIAGGLGPSVGSDTTKVVFPMSPAFRNSSIASFCRSDRVESVRQYAWSMQSQWPVDSGLVLLSASWAADMRRELIPSKKRPGNPGLRPAFQSGGPQLKRCDLRHLIGSSWRVGSQHRLRQRRYPPLSKTSRAPGNFPKGRF